MEEGSREVSREDPASCSFHIETRGNIILDLTRVDSTTASPQGSTGSNTHWDLASEQAESWVALEADIPPGSRDGEKGLCSGFL